MYLSPGNPDAHKFFSSNSGAWHRLPSCGFWTQLPRRLLLTVKLRSRQQENQALDINPRDPPQFIQRFMHVKICDKGMWAYLLVA